MKFTSEDFWTDTLDDYETPEIFAESMADIANARLRKMLADAPVVASEAAPDARWATDWIHRPNCKGKSYDRYQARLVCIEKIEKPNDSGEG